MKPAEFEGAVRRCRGGSTKESVECAISAKTKDELVNRLRVLQGAGRRATRSPSDKKLRSTSRARGQWQRRQHSERRRCSRRCSASVAHADPASRGPSSPRSLAAGDDARGAILVGPSGPGLRARRSRRVAAHAHAGGIGNTIVDRDAGRLGRARRRGRRPALSLRRQRVGGGLPRDAREGGRRARASPDRRGRPPGVRARRRHVAAAAGSSRAVLAIGASAGGVAIATERGVARLDGKAWSKLDEGAAHRDRARERALGDHRRRRGRSDLEHALRSWPHGSAVTAFVADGDTLVAAAAATPAWTCSPCTAGKLETEAVPLPPAVCPSASRSIAIGHAVLIARDGRVFVRDHGTWSSTEVRDALPAPRPGPAAAATD